MTEVDIILPRKNFDVVFRESFSDGITGIFGPSGSGKTSLLQAISGLALPKQGSIKIGERIVFDAEKRIDLPVEKRNIGYVFQEGRLFPHMNVEKNLLYGLKKNGNNKVSFNEVVDLLNLGHLLKSKPSDFRWRTAANCAGTHPFIFTRYFTFRRTFFGSRYQFTQSDSAIHYAYSAKGADSNAGC